MDEFDTKEQNELSMIDELLELVDECEEEADVDDESESFEDDIQHNDESKDSEESEPAKLNRLFSEAVSKVKDTFDRINAIAFHSYMEPDSKTIVKSKTSVITIASCTAAFIALAVVAYFFFTSFNYYTTGVTVAEFIDRFNNFELTSDSDIYQLIPSYTDVIIPDNAKLSGNNTIELMDGHVVIEAKTRFGKIVNLTVKNVDYPQYDAESFYFDTTDGSTDYLYYYVCLGKAIAAFQPEIKTVYDAVYSAYQMHQYAYIYYIYGMGDTYSVDVDNNAVAYHLIDACLTIEPIQKVITTAVWPEWLQADESEAVDSDLNGDNVVESDSDSGSVSDSSVSTSDVQ